MNITVRKASKEDLSEITSVHMQCFPDYFSTKLGKKLLRKYYEAYFEKFPDLFVVAIDEEKNKIVGFANGYIVGQNIQGDFIKNNAFSMALRILFLLICFDKTAWYRVRCMIKKPKSPEGRKSVKRGTGDLLSICMLDGYRGCGASGKLVEMFEDSLKKNNIYEYVLTVFPDNSRARGFYEKCGFDIYYETVEDVKYIKKLK